MILADAADSVVKFGAIAGAAITALTFFAVLAKAWRFLSRAERHLAVLDAIDRHIIDLDLTTTAWLRSLDLAATTTVSQAGTIAAHEARLNEKRERLDRLDRHMQRNTERLDDIETWIAGIEESGRS